MLATGRAIELFHEVRDAFDEAIRLADTGCDMALARVELKRAVAVLSELMFSNCGEMFQYELNELMQHGTYVEQRVDAQRSAAECERLYSQIQTFRRNPDALYRQQAAAARRPCQGRTQI